MSTPFFPNTGQRVVPLVTIDEDNDLTVVQARRNGSSPSVVKLRIFRIAFGSLFRATWLNIDGENCKVTYTKRE
jgi:hypothetical protein